MIFIAQACQWQEQVSSIEFKILPNKDQMCNDMRVQRHFNNPSDISFIVYTMKHLILDLIRNENHKFIHLISRCDFLHSLKPKTLAQAGAGDPSAVSNRVPSFIISIPRVKIDHCTIMDGDCLSVHIPIPWHHRARYCLGIIIQNISTMTASIQGFTDFPEYYI